MPRDGRYLEILGTYDPLKASDKSQFLEDRVRDWLDKGAQPSHTVRALLRQAGILKKLEVAPSDH